LAAAACAPGWSAARDAELVRASEARAAALSLGRLCEEHADVLWQAPPAATDPVLRRTVSKHEPQGRFPPPPPVLVAPTAKLPAASPCRPRPAVPPQTKQETCLPLHDREPAELAARLRTLLQLNRAVLEVLPLFADDANFGGDCDGDDGASFGAGPWAPVALLRAAPLLEETQLAAAALCGGPSVRTPFVGTAVLDQELGGSGGGAGAAPAHAPFPDHDDEMADFVGADSPSLEPAYSPFAPASGFSPTAYAHADEDPYAPSSPAYSCVAWLQRCSLGRVLTARAASTRPDSPGYRCASCDTQPLC
jgi:hypothetical protein